MFAEKPHLEKGKTFVLPCWCALDRDHTFDEFFEQFEEEEQ